MESPQVSTQLEGEAVSHVYPGASAKQSTSHPIPSLLPSSQVSDPDMIPSPHGKVQDPVPDPVQVASGSIKQVEEQPSPEIRFESSHVSPALMIPSPQIAAQVGAQLYPISTIQLFEHPSRLFKLASSHSSAPSLSPSPHKTKQDPGPVPIQSQPASIKQVAPHPSPTAVFPSSQFSGFLTVESPQIGVQLVVQTYPGSTVQS